MTVATTVASRSIAAEVLAIYVGAPTPLNRVGYDAGPPVLASQALAADIVSHQLAERVVSRWLGELPDGIRSFGAFGGVGGLLAGIRAGSAVTSEVIALAELTAIQIDRWLEQATWRRRDVAWRDYDLFNGPAGLLLCGADANGPTAPFDGAAQHLADLCSSPDLEPLRAGTDIDPRSAFNVGRINTGMGHGVTGVAAALRHATETLDDGQQYLPALSRAGAWLVNEAYLADGDFITWPPIGRDRAIPSRHPDTRQAWCYGTPGIAWTLWEIGRVLGDPAMQDLGVEAMRSFCLNFREAVHLDAHDVGEHLGMCHGAAGTMMVADTVERSTGLPEAGRLREILTDHIVERADQVLALAQRDMTILTGASGIASALITVEGGGRSWLTQFALN
jgi:hypothetical protein